MRSRYILLSVTTLFEKLIIVCIAQQINCCHIHTLLFTNIQFLNKEHVQKTFFVWKLFPTFGVLEKVWGSLQKFTTKTKNCLPLLFTISTKDKHSQPLKWFLLMPCWAFTLAEIFCESWYESNNKDNMYTLFYYWERETKRERERDESEHYYWRQF